jgi:hypothetical protein
VSLRGSKRIPVSGVEKSGRSRVRPTDPRSPVQVDSRSCKSETISIPPHRPFKPLPPPLTQTDCHSRPIDDGQMTRPPFGSRHVPTRGIIIVPESGIIHNLCSGGFDDGFSEVQTFERRDVGLESGITVIRSLTVCEFGRFDHCDGQRGINLCSLKSH